MYIPNSILFCFYWLNRLIFLFMCKKSIPGNIIILYVTIIDRFLQTMFILGSAEIAEKLTSSVFLLFVIVKLGT